MTSSIVFTPLPKILGSILHKFPPLGKLFSCRFVSAACTVGLCWRFLWVCSKVVAVAGDDGTSRDLVVLVRSIRDLLSKPQRPWGDREGRAAEIGRLAAAVASHGLDGEALVRFAFGLDIAVPLCFAIAIEYSDEDPDPEAQVWVDALSLQSVVFTSGDADSGGGVAERAVRSLSVVLRWVHHAPFVDVVSGTPPSAAVAKRVLENPEIPDGVVGQYRWVADRLSEPDPSCWASSSLTAEYRLRRGRSDQASAIPEAAQVDIDASIEDIAIAIADDAVLNGHNSEREHVISNEAVTRAKAFLRAKRYSDAAALFEFLGQTDFYPRTEGLNNRGFCWIPVDPGKADYFLESALSQGYDHVSLSTYNRMCCKVGQGDLAGARFLGERYWVDQYEDAARECTLWEWDSAANEWVLTEVSDPRDAIARLAKWCAKQEGWIDREHRWEARLVALRQGGHVL